MLLIVYLALFDDRAVIPTSSLYYESQLRPPSDDSCDVVYSCRFCFDPGTQTFPEQIFAYRPNILAVLTEISIIAPSGEFCTLLL